MCHQYNPTEVRYFDTFKTYNDELYALEFPEEWMMNHKKGTGPDCLNCLAHASWRGVLIGYCGNCATEYDGFSRGPGFCGFAVEYIVEDRPTENSAFNTYLDGAFLDEIGDIEFNPSDTIEAHIDFYKKLHIDGGRFIKREESIGNNPECNTVKNHIVEEGGGRSVWSELETNADIEVGDTIEYVSNNQMGWMKYEVILENGEKGLKVVDSYEMRESNLFEYV
jgi:hypothetical protein